MGVAILVSIIIGAGLLGGISNYFMNKTDRVWLGYDFVKSSLLGLTAAATVPLFLKTVSSNLMQECLNGDVISHFVFFGFCAVAAIFSSKFLQSLADKLLQEVQQVKQQQEEMVETQDILVRQSTEPEEPAVPPVETETVEEEHLESFKGGERSISTPVMSNDQKILKSLESGPYAFRTLSGISKDTGIEEKLVAVTLSEFESRGIVKKIKRSDGTVVWSMR
ncbi:MAG TPA: hypothetical protein PK228_10900 [Saprospiraceae bacterium]|nr:hypothetical protein [Saprospiraceae bacterium]